MVLFFPNPPYQRRQSPSTGFLQTATDPLQLVTGQLLTGQKIQQSDNSTPLTVTGIYGT
jgi:hypothetical protein